VLSRMSRKELLVSQSQQSDIYFATVLERGAHWDAGRPMRQQEQWEEHLAFLDRLSACDLSMRRRATSLESCHRAE
jgi:hypothetical protein